MAWSIQPVVEDNVLIKIELMDCSCVSLEVGDVIFTNKEDANNYFGVFWKKEWEKYKNWEKVYHSYINPLKEAQIRQQIEEEKNLIEEEKNLTKEQRKIRELKKEIEKLKKDNNELLREINSHNQSGFINW